MAGASGGTGRSEETEEQRRVGGGGGKAVDPRAEEGVDGDDDLLENGHAWLLSLDVSGLPVSISAESG